MSRETRRTGVFTRRALLAMGVQITALGALAARCTRCRWLREPATPRWRDDNSVSLRMIAPPRGRILDRFGAVVAGNKQNWRALLIAEQSSDIGHTLDVFSQIVPLDDHERARIERDIKRHRRFVPILVRDFLSWDDMARVEVNAPELPGILIDVGATRVYPFGDLLSHVIGYVAPPSESDVNGDPMMSLPGIRVGRAGIEKSREVELRGRAGDVQLEVNAYGRVIRELGRQEGAPGDDVELALDLDLQRTVQRRLGDESASAVYSTAAMAKCWRW